MNVSQIQFQMSLKRTIWLNRLKFAAARAVPDFFRKIQIVIKSPWIHESI